MFLTYRRPKPILPLGQQQSGGYPQYVGQSVSRPIRFSRQLSRRYVQSPQFPIPLGPSQSGGMPPFPSSVTKSRYSWGEARRNKRRYRQSDVVPILGPHLTGTIIPFTGTATRPRVPASLLSLLKRRYRQSDVWGILGPGRSAGHPPFVCLSVLRSNRRVSAEIASRAKRLNRQMGTWPATERGQSPGKPPINGQAANKRPAFFAFGNQSRRRFRQSDVVPILGPGLSANLPPFVGVLPGKVFAVQIPIRTGRTKRANRPAQSLPSGLAAGNPPFSGQSLIVARRPMTAEKSQRNKRRNRQLDPTTTVTRGAAAGHPPLIGQSVNLVPRVQTGEFWRRVKRPNKPIRADVVTLGPGLPFPLPPLPGIVKQNNASRRLYRTKVRQSDPIPELGPGLPIHPALPVTLSRPRFTARDFMQRSRRYRQSGTLPVFSGLSAKGGQLPGGKYTSLTVMPHRLAGLSVTPHRLAGLVVQ